MYPEPKSGEGVVQTGNLGYPAKNRNVVERDGFCLGAVEDDLFGIIDVDNAFQADQVEQRTTTYSGVGGSGSMSTSKPEDEVTFS